MMVIVLAMAASVSAAPPLDEIRSVIAKRLLRPTTDTLLVALEGGHLNDGLRGIDPYAFYVEPRFLTSKSPPARRLGVELFMVKSQVWAKPDHGGPAEKVGMPEIAALLAINGKSVQGDTLDRISRLLDAANQKDVVILTVASCPGGNGKSYKVRPTASISSSIDLRRSGSVIVVRISEFVSHDTAPGFSARFTESVRPGDHVVLDLRGCTGGDLFEALEIAGMFVPEGLPLISTYDRSGVEQLYRSPPGRKLRSPLWLLIDRQTASAGEILTGILQYHHLAWIVGERSYGKCVSQTLIPLSDGGGLWLTTLGIRFPDFTSCAGNGVTPNIPYPDISVKKLKDVINKISSLGR